MPESRSRLVLESILNHLTVIEDRFTCIETAADFVNTKHGHVLLDAISLRLQAIGENIKKISKAEPQLLEAYPEMEWDKMIRFRDVISHHYDLLDYEIIFFICSESLPELKIVVTQMLKEE